MEATILICFVIYTALLFLVMWLTSRKGAGNDAFFRGNRKSPWYVVAYGMIGASLSGVTFMSVPGYVHDTQFTYIGIVVGYLLGYAVIALVLLPLYYKLNLTSIYTYLDQRFGQTSYRTGSFFFIISRLLGSSLRMFLVVFVLYEFVFKAWGFPFWVPAVVFIVIILLYTFRGGIKTVIWTDTLQTTFFLLATIITIVCVLKDLDISLFDVLKRSTVQGYTKLFETDWRADNFFVKQILSGAFITIAMTGLDQDMMQKNLTCKTLKEAQKNMFTFSFSLILVNLLFLVLGATLLYYASETAFELPVDAAGEVVSDKIFPSVAFCVGPFTSVAFVLGLVAAGYSSADGTLTALTTSFCYDFLRFGTDTRHTEAQKVRIRKMVHVVFALLYLLIIIAFEPFHSDSLIATVFDVAGFTYGPLLGLFCFGLFTKRRTRDAWVPVVAVLSPIICYILKLNSEDWFWGYKFGFELLIINGLITFLGLLIMSKKDNTSNNI